MSIKGFKTINGNTVKYDYNSLDNLPAAYSLPVASSSERGGIKVGYQGTGANLALKLSSEKGYITLTKDAIIAGLGYTPGTSTAEPYTHPIGTAAGKTSGLYKFSTDEYSHIKGVTEVTKSDITSLGIPGSDTTYSKATSDTLGLVKTGYSASGKNYAVSLDSNGKMYVNVPWENTTYKLAGSSGEYDGLMSSHDKAKLDSIATGATKVIVDEQLDYNSPNAIANAAVGTKFNQIVDLINNTNASINNLNASLGNCLQANLNYRTNGMNYKVQMDENGSLFVYVPGAIDDDDPTTPDPAYTAKPTFVVVNQSGSTVTHNENNPLGSDPNKFSLKITTNASSATSKITASAKVLSAPGKNAAGVGTATVSGKTTVNVPLTGTIDASDGICYSTSIAVTITYYDSSNVILDKYTLNITVYVKNGSSQTGD